MDGSHDRKIGKNVADLLREIAEHAPKRGGNVYIISEEGEEAARLRSQILRNNLTFYVKVSPKISEPDRNTHYTVDLRKLQLSY